MAGMKQQPVLIDEKQYLVSEHSEIMVDESSASFPRDKLELANNSQ